MQFAPVKVPLKSPEEVAALFIMAESEGRTPYEQLRWLFLQEARNRGLLGTGSQATTADLSKEARHAAS